MKRKDRNKVQIGTIVGPKGENDADSAETNLIGGAVGVNPVEVRPAEGNKVQIGTIVGPKGENDADSAETNLIGGAVGGNPVEIRPAEGNKVQTGLQNYLKS
jgi:hypothetical protein